MIRDPTELDAVLEEVVLAALRASGSVLDPIAAHEVRRHAEAGARKVQQEAGLRDRSTQALLAFNLFGKAIRSSAVPGQPIDRVTIVTALKSICPIWPICD